jgi:hypothetical protein
MILPLLLETGFCSGLRALAPLVAREITDLQDTGLTEIMLQLLVSCIYNVFLVFWDTIKT